jgi:hypothetical protein
LPAVLEALLDGGAGRVEAGLEMLIAEHGSARAVAAVGEVRPDSRRAFEALSWIEAPASHG